jgi:hypothetical protein
MQTMTLTDLLEPWQSGLADGSIVPYLGPGVLADVLRWPTVAAFPRPASN